MPGIEYIFIVISVLIIVSIIISKLSDNIGVPSLVLFLLIGMLAGSEGIGKIYFDDIFTAQTIGTLALIFILFSGGLDTKWESVRNVMWQSVSLSTIGVLITAAIIGITVNYFFGVGLLESLLLGSIISSTDAAAVFSVLRSKNVNLKKNIKPLLEFESGSNDPMAIFLTILFTGLITSQIGSVLDVSLLVLSQFLIGGASGFVLGKLIVMIVNKIKFYYEGIYLVLTLAFAIFTFSITSIIGGSGFLAVYIAGILIGNSYIVQKKTLFRFFDGLAWLGQIGMFLTLGLLVFPNQLIPVITEGLWISLILILFARPVSVFLSLLFTGYKFNEKIFISWVGLRGAVPIILATIPFTSGIPNASLYFNLIFFIVLTSALVQGWTIPFFAKILRVKAKPEHDITSPIEFTGKSDSETQLVDFIIPYRSKIIGKSLVDLNLPADSLVVLICRNEKFIVPSGGTTFEEGDILQILVNKDNAEDAIKKLSKI
jgi:cell volume regulation protein A